MVHLELQELVATYTKNAFFGQSFIEVSSSPSRNSRKIYPHGEIRDPRTWRMHDKDEVQVGKYADDAGSTEPICHFWGGEGVKPSCLSSLLPSTLS